MTKRSDRAPDDASRKDRLKAALKANMAKRKAQARARRNADAKKGEEPGQ